MVRHIASAGGKSGTAHSFDESEWETVQHNLASLDARSLAELLAGSTHESLTNAARWLLGAEGWEKEGLVSR